MADVADFVAEHRLDLVRREILKQTIREDDIANANGKMPITKALAMPLRVFHTRILLHRKRRRRPDASSRLRNGQTGSGLQTEHQTHDPRQGHEDEQHGGDANEIDGFLQSPAGVREETLNFFLDQQSSTGRNTSANFCRNWKMT